MNRNRAEAVERAAEDDVDVERDEGGCDEEVAAEARVEDQGADGGDEFAEEEGGEVDEGVVEWGDGVGWRGGFS